MSEEKRGASPEDQLDALWCRADALKNTVVKAEADAKKRASRYPWALLILAAVLLTAAVATQCSSDARADKRQEKQQEHENAAREDQQEHEREMQEADQKRERESKPRKTE